MSRPEIHLSDVEARTVLTHLLTVQAALDVSIIRPTKRAQAAATDAIEALRDIRHIITRADFRRCS